MCAYALPYPTSGMRAPNRTKLSVPNDSRSGRSGRSKLTTLSTDGATFADGAKLNVATSSGAAPTAAAGATDAPASVLVAGAPSDVAGDGGPAVGYTPASPLEEIGGKKGPTVGTAVGVSRKKKKGEQEGRELAPSRPSTATEEVKSNALAPARGKGTRRKVCSGGRTDITTEGGSRKRGPGRPRKASPLQTLPDRVSSPARSTGLTASPAAPLPPKERAALPSSSSSSSPSAARVATWAKARPGRPDSCCRMSNGVDGIVAAGSGDSCSGSSSNNNSNSRNSTEFFGSLVCGWMVPANSSQHRFKGEVVVQEAEAVAVERQEALQGPRPEAGGGLALAVAPSLRPSRRQISLPKTETEPRSRPAETAVASVFEGKRKAVWGRSGGGGVTGWMGPVLKKIKSIQVFGRSWSSSNI